MDERYLTSFEDQTTALGYTSGDTTLVSPMVSLVGADVVYSKEIPHESRIKFAKDEATGKLYFIVDVVGPADDEIWYTSSDGNIVTPYITTVFGASIVSNTYEDGKGVIKFDNSVTSIGNGAFNRRSSLTSITIPNSVIIIEDYAFCECTSLTSITIPNSVTSVWKNAFAGCSSLTSMVVASSNSTYDSRENCNAIIETATNTLIAGCQNTIIPNSVTSIGESAFQNCSGLTSVTIPNSVTSIGDFAFYACDSLASIIFEGTIQEWNSITKGYAWKNYTQATYVQCSDGQVTL